MDTRRRGKGGSRSGRGGRGGDKHKKTKAAENTVRDEQVRQCMHVLPGFKLFRAGDYVNVYSVSVREPRAAHHTKLQVSVPHNYPQSALKLTFTTNRSRSDTICRNFKNVSKRWTRENWTILEQLNFLVSTLDDLTSNEYPKLLEMKQRWFSTAV